MAWRLRQLGPMDSILPPLGDPAPRAAPPARRAFLARGRGADGAEGDSPKGYVYAPMAFSAMVAALNSPARKGRHTKRGISPAVTIGEIA